MKGRGFWLLPAIASAAALFLTGRSDWSVLTGNPVSQTGTVAVIAPGPYGGIGRWHGVYRVPGNYAQLIRVRDTALGSSLSAEIDSIVRMIRPKGKSEEARAIALDKRRMFYLGLVAGLAIALMALVRRENRTDGLAN